MNPFSGEEQTQFLRAVQDIRDRYSRKGWGWSKLRGDAFVRIVQRFLQRHLPAHTKLVRTAWVQGCGTEFDLLVVRRNAKHDTFANAYSRDDVYLTIEVKGAGVFYKQREVEDRLREWKVRLQKESGKHLVYITLWERAKTYPDVIRALGREDTFVMKVGSHVQAGEWTGFLDRVASLLTT